VCVPNISRIGSLLVSKIPERESLPSTPKELFDAFFTTNKWHWARFVYRRSIVESHGGRLSVFPAHPHGSVFQLMLPAATNFLDPTVQPEWGPSPPTEASYSAGFRDFKALIEFLRSLVFR
jgi:hypothetical protein